nr:immunoglobulin heavy chain junction region [Macaca mulatta]MOV51314.1 immunoglobulin heavy chain junction region [Macaca mulatta]MOV51741.1 immunoglobulin heavy chain junction region [Macaca mulatta]
CARKWDIIAAGPNDYW